MSIVRSLEFPLTPAPLPRWGEGSRRFIIVFLHTPNSERQTLNAGLNNSELSFDSYPINGTT